MELRILVILSSLSWATAEGRNREEFQAAVQQFPIADIQTLLLPLQEGSFLAAFSTDSNATGITRPCLDDIFEFIGDLRARKPSAVQALDAFGKIPPGLSRGHLQWFGAYDECLDIVNATVNYCLVRIGSSDDLNVIQQSPALGTCFPRTCGKSDIEFMINYLIELIAKRSPIPIPELKTLRARSTVCEFDKPWEAGAFATIALIAVFVIVCTFGSIVACCPAVARVMRRRSTFTRVVEDLEDEPILREEHEVHGTEITEEPLENLTTAQRFFYSFSFRESWKFFTEKRPDEISYLNGMRVATIWWVILGKEFSLSEFAYENALDYFDGMKTFLGQLVTSANLAVDTFFILSGLVLTYTILKKLEKNAGKINWFWLYIRRYLRLTPVYVIMMLIYIYLVPHIVDGPFTLLVGQDVGENPIDFCKRYWWTNVLYVNNFVPTDTTHQCTDWTWFLAVEMQLFLITPIIVFILYKWTRVGLGLVVSLVVGCLVANAVIEAHWGLPIAMFQDPLRHNETYNPNFDYVGTKPYTRATPYFLGMILGCLFVKRAVWKFPYQKLDLVFNIGCWISSCIIANKVLFGLYDEAYTSPIAVNMLGRVSWQMLSRFGFSISICWVIFACQYGYAGPVRDILEWKVWRPLSHLTYGVYLFHPLSLQLWLVTQRDPFYFNVINMTSLFCSQLLSVYSLSFIFAVLVEFPLLRLERAMTRQ